LERVWVSGANLEPCPPPKIMASVLLLIIILSFGG
jgi:hypothetical protein